LGYVTKQQFLNNAFDTSPTSRTNQDVGLDGAGNTLEQQKFQKFIAGVPGSAQTAVNTDPSADDFQYFLGGDLDTRHNGKSAGVLERYKSINGLENNSPVLTGNEPYTKSRHDHSR